MPPMPDSLFATDAAHALLDLELRALAPQLAGLYGPQGLFVRAHESAPRVISAPMLARLLRLHADTPQHLAGDAACAIQSLPFADDSFRVVLVQHAHEALGDASAFQDEVARVLAPDGVAIVVGFAPVSPWRGWIAAQQRGGAPRLNLATPGQWRRALARHGVDAYAVRRIGSVFPQPSADRREHSHRGTLWQRGLDPLRSSFLLLARKRRGAVTPLRLRPRERPAIAPRFAPGAQRARA